MAKFKIQVTVTAFVEQDEAPIGLVDADFLSAAQFIEGNAIGFTYEAEVTAATQEEIDELDDEDDLDEDEGG